MISYLHLIGENFRRPMPDHVEHFFLSQLFLLVNKSTLLDNNTVESLLDFSTLQNALIDGILGNKSSWSYNF